MKRLFTVGIIALLLGALLFVFSACNTSGSNYGEELIVNGNFETSNENSKLEGWSVKTVNSHGSFQKTGTSDNYYLKISNGEADASYAYQEVSVTKNATYKITYSIEVKTSVTRGSDDTYRGAYVTFLENPTVIIDEILKATDGWETHTVYVKTSNSSVLTICLKLGAENARSSGSVYFDNVSMMRENAPADASVILVKKIKGLNLNTTVSGGLFVAGMALLGVAIMIGAYIMMRKLYAKKNTFVSFNEETNGKTKLQKFFANPWTILGLIVIVALAVRFIFLFTMYGLGQDMTSLANSAQAIFQKGPHKFYNYAETSTTAESWILYSPGSIYMLYFLGGIGQNLDISALAQLVRVPSILADIAVIAMIFFYGKKYVGTKLSAIFASVYALIPVSFLFSGVAASFDSITVALLLATVILLIEKKYPAMLVVYMLAVLMSLSALALSPILLAYFVYQIYKSYRDNDGKFVKNIVVTISCTIGMFVAFYILTLPVSIQQIQGGDAFFIFAKYADMMRLNNVFVDNAFNLYGMVTMNNQTVSNAASILNLLFILVLEIYVVSLYFKNKNRLEILLLTSFVYTILAVFTLKINATYIFLAIAPLVVYTMLVGEKRLFVVLAALVTLAGLNITQTINISGFLVSYSESALVNYNTSDVFYIFFSVVMVLVTLYYAYVVYSICNNSKRKDIPAMKDKLFPTIKNWWEVKIYNARQKRADKK